VGGKFAILTLMNWQFQQDFFLKFQQKNFNTGSHTVQKDTGKVAIFISKTSHKKSASTNM